MSDFGFIPFGASIRKMDSIDQVLSYFYSIFTSD